MTRFKQINTLIGLTLLVLIAAASARASDKAPSFNLDQAQAGERAATSAATTTHTMQDGSCKTSSAVKDATAAKGLFRTPAIVGGTQMDNRHKHEAPDRGPVVASFIG